MAPPTKALAPIEQALQGYADTKHNVLAPLTYVDRLPSMTRLSVRVVQVTDVSDKSPDCYHSSMFMKSNERAPSKLLLDKIAGAAGLTWEPGLCRRLDDGKDPHVCIWQSAATLLDYDGVKRMVVKSKLLDLRDGSPQLTGFRPKQTAQARARILELAESKACNRVVRAALAMKQVYTVEEIQRPFVIPRLVPDFDMDDPEVKRTILEHRLGIEHQLYGPAKGVRVDDSPVKETPSLPPGTIDVEAVDDVPVQTVPEGVFPGDPEEEGDRQADVRCGCVGCCNKETGEVCAEDLTGEDAIIEYTTKNFGTPLCARCCVKSKQYDSKAHSRG